MDIENNEYLSDEEYELLKKEFQEEISKIKPVEQLDFTEFEEDEDYYDEEDEEDPNILNLEFFPVTEDFVKSHSRLSSIMGPVGSGKSVACLIKLFIYAHCIKKCRDGIRRSRYIIVRNTQKELRDTTIRTFLQWFGRFGKFKSTEMNFYMEINDVQCEIQFIALDRPEDTKKLLSLECTGMYFNELREIEPLVWRVAQQRIGRFPSLKGNGTKAVFDLEMAKQFGFDNLDFDSKKNIQMECMWSDTNPPMMGSYFHKLFEKQLFNEDTGKDENPKNFKLFRQPGGLDPSAENVKYLPEDYYQNLIDNSTKEETDVMVHCKYGLSEAGLAVYGRAFDRSEHVVKDVYKTKYSRNHKLAVGMDFGLNPCCVISQYIDGVLHIYKEVITLNKNKRALEEFLRVDLIPILRKEFPHHKLNGSDIVVFGDPAGNQRNQLNGKPLYQELKDKGFAIRLENIDNNRIMPRIEAVKKLLLPNPLTKKTQIHIDEKRCPFLIDAFQGNYYYKKTKNNNFEDVPEKNEYSHVSDAFQYLSQHILKYKGRYLDRNDYYQHNEYRPADNLIGY